MDKTQKVCQKIDSIVNYISPYMSFINCHMVEYITKKHWNTLMPQDIRSEIEVNGCDTAVEAFWQIRQNICQNNINNLKSDEEDKFKNLKRFIEEADKHRLKEDEYFVSLNFLNDKLRRDNAVFYDSIKIDEFMSNKKSHEVEVMSKVVATLFNWSKSTHVIDLGGGKGYLSSVLSMLYNIPVLNIDCRTTTIKGALDHHSKLQKYWPGIVQKALLEKNIKDCGKQDYKFKNSDVKSDYLNSCKHVVHFITENTNLLDIVNNHFHDEDDLQNKKLFLTGLHTCGSLSTASIKSFTQSSSASTLFIVPCCYHLLKEAHENSKDFNFPMSRYLKGFSIGRNGRMLSCKAIERVTGFKEIATVSLYYRALLQVLIGDSLSDGNMRNLKNKYSNFYEYVQIATKRLKLSSDVVNMEKNYFDEFEVKNENNRNHLEIFYLLRMCFGPVIESLVLLDKLLFLLENGYDGQLGEVYLIQTFNPVLSPRCTSLFAFKK